MRIFKKILLLICIAGVGVCSTESLCAQRKSDNKQARQQKETAAADTVKKETEAKTPVPLEKFIRPDASSMQGLTTVYKQNGKYYLNINDTLLGRDIRMVSRISRAAEGIQNSYAGDVINSAMFRFVKGPDNKIFLKSLQYEMRSDTSAAMFQNVEHSNYPAIVATFPIKARSIDNKDNIIDVTDFLLSDPEYLFFSKWQKKRFKLGSLQKDKSYIEGIKTFPLNTEMKVVNTYSREENEPTITYMLNASFVLLPRIPMVARYADARVGYFTETYTDFDKNPQRVERTRLITRWRLEPKPEDMEKYRRGELVEPAKPIIFYIDPATPKEWVPYLIQGVNDWQGAFEKAGFKNAIYALEAPSPAQDSTWSLEDARHSVIVYKPSDIANASGPHVSDPRSGEILESHINWYHNVMSLLRNWYFIQASPSDPGARKMTFDPELMGQLIRFVSSHEVGHTLGLRHNFGGSSHYTASQLRDPEFLRENGNSASIMDYSRFNYVAQPEDNVPREQLFPKIGPYDKWAIEWGYRKYPDINDPQKELSLLNKQIIEKLRNPVYEFGTESDPDDPRYQREDLGADHMETNELGIKNLKYIMGHLGEWTKEPNEDYQNLKILYGEIVTQYNRYNNHVAKWIGGIYTNPKKVEQPGPVVSYVEKEKQEKAMDFLKRNLFDPQLWLIPEDVLNKTGDKTGTIMEDTYSSVLKNILSKRVLLNLYNAQIALGNKAYSPEDLFAGLDRMIWVPLTSGNEKDILRRLLQKSYTDALTHLYADLSQKDNSDAVSLVYYQLSELEKKLKSQAVSAPAINKAHYLYLADKIDRALTETEHPEAKK